eukprot:SAG11_NODE_15330_length_581_cov_2.989627_1_plen_41_part_10
MYVIVAVYIRPKSRDNDKKSSIYLSQVDTQSVPDTWNNMYF